jgi:hypothetical protein
MAHLLKFRKGWQSEHIAKFILSRFSFVAEPSTVADDIGSDFMCTLFKVENNKYLIPQSSFTIQIKSNKDDFEITKNCSYFQNLEIPYLIGVVDKDNLLMRVYSGESIPHFFSCYTGKIFNGKYKALIRLLDHPPHRNHNFISCDDSKQECYLDFPFIVELKALNPVDPDGIDALLEVCRLIQYNISARSTKSYLYYLYGWKGINVYTGKESVKTFRKNFYDSFCELLLNLEEIYTNYKNEFDYEEYEIYKTTIERLIKKHGVINGALENIFLKLDKKISSKS